MAPLPAITTTFLLPLLLLTTASASASTPTTTTLLSELGALRSRSKAGVIRLDDQLVDRFLTSAPRPRPYSLLLFFDAALVRDNPALNLPALCSDFALVSSHNPSASLFFCDVEFSQSQRSFSDLNVTSLPHIRFFAPDGSEAVMPPEAMPGMADSIAEFVEATTGVRVGPIVRPPPISSWSVAAFGIPVALTAPFVIQKVLKGETVLSDRRFWMVSSLMIYFFSVSGSMYGVIRNMPMAIPDQNNPSQVNFFYQGSDIQLGAEGLVIGFLYMAVGVILALVTHGLARVEDVGAQRAFMIAAMIVSAWAVRKVVYLDNWKTGYSVHMYWPSRWR